MLYHNLIAILFFASCSFSKSDPLGNAKSQTQKLIHFIETNDSPGFFSSMDGRNYRRDPEGNILNFKKMHDYMVRYASDSPISYQVNYENKTHDNIIVQVQIFNGYDNRTKLKHVHFEFIFGPTKAYSFRRKFLNFFVIDQYATTNNLEVTDSVLNIITGN